MKLDNYAALYKQALARIRELSVGEAEQMLTEIHDVHTRLRAQDVRDYVAASAELEWIIDDHAPVSDVLNRLGLTQVFYPQ